MGSKRVRTTVTVREDDPVPAKKRGKKTSRNSGLIVALLILGFIFLVMNQKRVTPQHQPVVAGRSH